MRTITLSLLLFTSLLLWATITDPVTAAAPTPITQTPVVELLNPRLEGALIALQAQPLQPGLWTRVQWQDTHGGWHDIEGWQGAFNPDQQVLWYVGPEHLGTGPFRWLVYQEQGGNLLGVSQPFDLPSRGGELLRVALSLPDPRPAPQPSPLESAAHQARHPAIVVSLAGDWFWTSDFNPGWLALSIYDSVADDAALLWAGSAEANEAGFIHVLIEDHGLDLLPGHYLVISDGATEKGVVLETITLDVFDTENEIMAGTAPAGREVTVVAGHAEPDTQGIIVVVADPVSGAWSADFKRIGFDITRAMGASFAQIHDEDGDANEAGVPPLSENVAAGRPIVVSTNGADYDRENPGMEPADITDGRLDYLAAGDALEDGVVGYVNDDYNEPMVITVTIDLQGTYDISRIRYTTGNVQRAETWHADRMTTPFGTTPTNPGRPGTWVWSEHTGNATVSSITIVLEKTRVSYATDWLFIGEIEVYGVPAQPAQLTAGPLWS